MTTRILLVTGNLSVNKSGLYALHQRLITETNTCGWTVYKHPEANSLLQSSKFPKFHNPKCSTFESIVKQLPNQDCMITDWRSDDEYRYLLGRYNNIITARMFRSSILESRSRLDNWATEYLIVSNTLDESEFKVATKCFPFYKNYVICDYL